MTEPDPQVDPAVAAMVDSEAVLQDQISDNLVAALMVLWSGFTAYYAGDAVAELGRQMARLVVLAQRQAGRITEAYLRQQIRRMGEDLPAGTIVDLPEDLRLGAETADVYQRPVREVRYLESTGIPLEEAVDSATERLESLVLTDLQIARTNAAQQVMYAAPDSVGIRGYRRIIHPELGQVCGLCIAAADRIYQKKDLLPMHKRCKCTTIPVIGARDPGLHLNEDDLARLYAAAGGSTATGALARVRYEIKENGELGPVLAPAGDNFRGPAQVQRQLGERAAGMRRQQLERQIAELRNQGRLSDWHRDRLEQLEQLLDAA